MVVYVSEGVVYVWWCCLATAAIHATFMVSAAAVSSLTMRTIHAELFCLMLYCFLVGGALCSHCCSMCCVARAFACTLPVWQTESLVQCRDALYDLTCVLQLFCVIAFERSASGLSIGWDWVHLCCLLRASVALHPYLIQCTTMHSISRIVHTCSTLIASNAEWVASFSPNSCRILKLKVLEFTEFSETYCSILHVYVTCHGSAGVGTFVFVVLWWKMPKLCPMSLVLVSQHRRRLRHVNANTKAFRVSY